MGRLTTHVLDTANGRPAGGVPGRLYAIDGVRMMVAEFTTNDDGRVDAPLLDEEDFACGTYELVFDVGDYFGAINAGEKPFLSDITLRFYLGEDDHYHVPLLVTPWGYTTYRGS
ncbi:MAG: hydroxyisourate hydrolase [Gammaproteobacteria bacterium]|nr:hydroxyisourate hydrolase [Gammaproteobacteria bacterium]